MGAKRMSELTPDPTATPDPQPQGERPVPTAPATEPKTPAREETDWKAEARKWELRAKENMADLKPLKEQMDGLRAVFGDKAESGTDVVASLQEQMAAMQKDNLVNRVARRHGITEDDDIELLRSLPDEGRMTHFATRLKSNTPAAPAAPAHDPSQGSAPLTPEAAEAAAYAAYFPSKT